MLVAKAKATPENVVPCQTWVSTCQIVRHTSTAATYKVNSNNQLRLAPARTLYLDRTGPVVRLRALRGRRLLRVTTTIGILLRIARWSLGLLLTVDLLWRRVSCGLRRRVYGRRRHWAVRASRMRRGAELASWGSIGVRWRAAELIGIVHLTRLRARSRSRRSLAGG